MKSQHVEESLLSDLSRLLGITSANKSVSIKQISQERTKRDLMQHVQFCGTNIKTKIIKTTFYDMSNSAQAMETNRTLVRQFMHNSHF